MDLPFFRYHPDPLATGMIESTDAECPCCEQVRGYRYTSIPYGEEEVPDLCPWCIADGSSHVKFDVEFTDAYGIGDSGSWETVSESVVQQIVTRTPGFSGWQQERWWTHCGDAAAYLGRAGHQELENLSEMTNYLKDQVALSEQDWQGFYQELEKDGSPTAYVFRCLHCGAYGGYTDAD